MTKVLSISVFLLLFISLHEAPGAAPRDTNVVLVDPRPFKCICYSGYRDGQTPGGAEPTQAQVREDLVLLKNYTHEIRTYGSGKTTHGYGVPKLADSLNLKVHLGIWLDDTYSEAINLAAIDDAVALIKEGHKSIASVIVGNEFMYRVRNIDKRPEAPALARLVNYVKVVRAAIPASILVTNADTWSDVEKNSDALLTQLDYVIWHSHPWWEVQPIASAATYVGSRLALMQTRVDKIGGKRLVLGETGWPTQINNGAAVGSPQNQHRYFKELIAWFWNNYAETWAFTAFDETWKGAEGPVGAHWGFLTTTRQPQYIISNIASLMPRYMQSENPNLPVSLRNPARISALPRRTAPGALRDILGRDAKTFGALEEMAQGHLLTPFKTSRGLLIIAP